MHEIFQEFLHVQESVYFKEFHKNMDKLTSFKCLRWSATDEETFKISEGDEAVGYLHV